MASGFVRLLPGGDPATGLQPSDMVAPEAFTGDDKTELALLRSETNPFALQFRHWRPCP